MRAFHRETAFLLVTVVSAHMLATQISSGAIESASFPDRRAAIRAEQLLSEAKSLLEQGRYSLARAKVDDAVATLAKGERSISAAESLIALSRVFDRGGRFQDAIFCLRWVLEGGTSSYSVAINTEASTMLGDLLVKVSRPDLAMGHYKFALAAARAASNQVEQNRALAGLACVHTALGDVTGATRFLNELQRQESHSSELEARTLAMLAGVHRARGLRDEARRMFESCLDIYRRSGDRENQIRILAELSALDLEGGHKAAALELGQSAVAMAREEGVGVDARWRAWLALGRAQRAAGDRRSTASYFMAFGMVEAQSIILTADQLKMAFLAERQCVYEELADLYISTGRPDEAFRVAEHGRARVTLDMLSVTRVDGSAAAPEYLAALQANADRTTSLKRQLLSPALTAAQRSEIEDSLRKAAVTREEMEIDSQGLRRFTRPVDPNALREKVLAAGEMLVEFMLGEMRSHLWLVTNESLRCIELPPRRVIEREIAAYFNVLSARPSALHFDRDIARQRTAASEMFEMLLAGAAPELASARALTIVPDGPLFYLPFETLIHNGHYLIEDYDIGYTPSSSVLSVLRERSGRKRSERREFLAFGDPEPSRKGSGLATRDRVSGTRLRSASLARLPNAAAEIATAASLFPPGQSSVYTGAAASEAAFKRASTNGFNVIHFATHALIDEKSPAHTALVLATDGGSTEDGLLEVSEIAALNLDCEMVVLSACGTARGKLMPGEGMLGLTRAFLYAGARAMVVTLWDVSDLTTAELITEFYRDRASGNSARSALRQSKIKLIRGRGLSRHPYYWSPLILVGSAQ